MKIILLKDVPGTGRRNDVKEVSAGFAMNFLVPNRLALKATDQAVAKIETDKTRQSEEGEIQETLLISNLESLSGAKVLFKEKANEEGVLFGSIHLKEVSEEIKKQLKINIPIDCIKLEKPIKTAGETKVVASHPKKKVEFIVLVERLD